MAAINGVKRQRDRQQLTYQYQCILRLLEHDLNKTTSLMAQCTF